MSDLKRWLMSATVRALKTAAQAAIGIIGAATILGDVSWPMVISGAALAAVVSYLTSIAGLPEVDGGASLSTLVCAGDQGSTPSDGPVPLNGPNDEKSDL